MMRFLTISALVVALSVGASAQQRPSLSVPFTQFTLPNGLTVMLHRDASVPVVTVNVWYHVGSANERPGRTGFAHLFEHVMFEGSMHVPEGQFDNWLEAAGGNNNGSTTTDRTNYYEDLPSNALELALFLESDRMGFLLDDKAPDKINGQRDVVKNEKRQGVDNQPYGQAYTELSSLLYPPGHPYSWPTIGSMEDLTAASFEDVARFFRTYYVPSNASLVIAGDIDIDATRKMVEKWFSDVPAAVIPGVAHAVSVQAWGCGNGRRLQPALRRQELEAVSPAGLRHADRAGRQRLPAVAGPWQQLHDCRDGQAGPVAGHDPAGH